MLLNTALKLPPLSVGDNVRVPILKVIPKVDKGKLGPNHILGVITKVSNNSYSIGTEKVTLDRKIRIFSFGFYITKMSNELTISYKNTAWEIDSLRYWLSKVMEIQENYFTIDFYGSEILW